MASKKGQQSAGSVERSIGQNRGPSRSFNASSDSLPKSLKTKLDSDLSEVADLTYSMRKISEKISEKIEAIGLAGQSSDSPSNYSLTSVLESKLESLRSEMANLTSIMLNETGSEGGYEQRVNKINRTLPTIENRLGILESLVLRLQGDRSGHDTDERLTSLEKLLDTLKHQELPAIETKVNISLNDLQSQVLPGLEARLNLLETFPNTTLKVFESRLDALESPQNEVRIRSLESINTRLNKLESLKHQTSADLENRLKTLETSVNKLQDQVLPAIETRFTCVTSSIEKRQDKDKEETKKDVHDLATVVDVLCNNKLSNDEAKTVKTVAERFGMKNTVEKLTRFFRNTLTLVTCVQIFKQEFGQTLITHRNDALKMIQQNFNMVSETVADFCELSLEELRCLIYSNELRATAEQMFNAISKWVERDRFSRTSVASLLIPAVHFSRCSVTFLRGIRDHFLVKAHLPAKCSLEEIITKFDREVLFVFGGYSSEGMIEILNKSKSSWIPQKKISNGPYQTTFVFSARRLILVLEGDNKRFRSFDTLTKTWNDLRPLPIFRYRMSAAMETNKLFVMGGEEHDCRCDVYDIHLDSWKVTKSLNIGRWWSASSSLYGKIYCCGGRARGGYFLSSMEVFYPKEKSIGWTMTASMSVGRDDHSLVSCGQYLWAVGGYNGSYLTTLEKYVSSTNSWSKMMSMPTGRSALTASFFGGRLYAIGGNYGMNTVEVYDPDENRWTTGASLNKGRSFHASCVVKNIYNVEEYQCFNRYVDEIGTLLSLS